MMQRGKNKKMWAWIILSLIFIVPISYGIWLWNSWSACIVTEDNQQPSPDGKYIAARVYVDCGATEGYQYIGLRRKSDKFASDDSDDVFSTSGTASTGDFRWQSARTLIVTCPKKLVSLGGAKPEINSRTSWHDVKIALERKP